MTNLNRKEAIDVITAMCGLPRHIVRDLLFHGWTFEHTLNKPMRWIHPMAQFKEFEYKYEVPPLETEALSL